MKCFKEIKSVYQFVKPFYFISSIFGLACYKFDSKVKKLKATVPRIIVLVLMLCFWIWNIYEIQQFVTYDDEISTRLMNKIFKNQYLLQHILGPIVLIFNFTQRTTVGNILESLNSFDQHGKSLGWIFETSLTFYKAMFALLLFCAVLLSADCAYLFIVLPETPLVMILDYVYFMVFFLVISQQFILSANLIDIRLTAMIENFK